MADEKLALIELLEKVGEGDFLRTVAEAVLQLLMEADVEGLSAPVATSAMASAALGATASAIAAWTHGSVSCSSASRNCGEAATFRPSSRPARARKRRWWQ